MAPFCPALAATLLAALAACGPVPHTGPSAPLRDAAAGPVTLTIPPPWMLPHEDRPENVSPRVMIELKRRPRGTETRLRFLDEELGAGPDAWAEMERRASRIEEGYPEWVAVLHSWSWVPVEDVERAARALLAAGAVEVRPALVPGQEARLAAIRARLGRLDRSAALRLLLDSWWVPVTFEDSFELQCLLQEYGDAGLDAVLGELERRGAPPRDEGTRIDGPRLPWVSATAFLLACFAQAGQGRDRLLAALRSPAADVRRLAATALAVVPRPAPDVKEALSRLASDPVEEVRDAAQEALWTLRWE